MTLSILQVNSSDAGGGAEAVALALHRAYRARGLDASFAVGCARTGEEGVIPIGSARSRRSRALRDPRVALDLARGREDFRFPASHGVLDLPHRAPEIVHLHNLHGAYFDLRVLPALSAQVPAVATLHDPWLLTGHCAHPFDCDGWTRGCGHCPYLATYPALRRDGTAANLERKRQLYSQATLSVVTPSAWLMEMVDHSILAPAASLRRVIPNGVDLAVFAPGDHEDARATLDLPREAHVLVFAAPGARTNPFKDFATLEAALTLLGASDGPDVIAITLGEAGDEVRLGRVMLRSLPFTGREEVATYLRAADLYVHATLADNHPLAVLEALASGVPVVASRVGGIREQIREETGVLVDPGEAEALARAIVDLLDDPERRGRMGEAAAADARVRFDLERQVEAYLDLYRELMC